MRNWNKKKWGKRNGKFRIASLPMRNWNAVPGPGHRKGPSIASLPMRNWNFFTSSYPVRFFPNCQPTYEELKRPIGPVQRLLRIKLPAYLWGIETGTGGVVLWGVNGLPAYLWGIETQKELNLLRSQRRIASLPMRNWNLFRQFDVMAQNGIASLPMRNWNSTDEAGGIGSGSDCQPTYEELKQG